MKVGWKVLLPTAIGALLATATLGIVMQAVMGG
jgi:NADH:ubiquinone oxidoreductase subunit H